MKRSIQNYAVSVSAFLLLSIAALFSTGCTALVSDQQEIALGQRYEAELSQKSRTMSDAYLTNMGTQLAAYAPARPNIRYQFSIVEDAELNAFTIPGGHIYVNTETIKSCTNASELAAVTAHEIAHVALLHHKQTIGSTMGLDLLNQVLLSRTDESAAKLAQLVEQGVLMKFSRAQEYSADEMAISMMYQAGYDPNGLVTFFQKLVSRYGSGSKVFEILSSHPVTNDRIAAAQAIIAQLPPRPGLVTESAQFQSFQARY